ncbi:MAG: hypothetical protein GYA62_06780 [Bacteroidales bacterium]|nr:hypothetical protein [Bacteroidales bacterium]
MNKKARQKFLLKMNSIDIQCLLELATRIENIESDKTNKAYPYLIKCAQREAEHRDLEAIIGLAHMVYGWMPTMVECDWEKYNENIWDKIIEGDITEAFLSTIKAITNNSIVGASKLLHFCNPEKYAIWDSRVYKRITNETPYDSRVNDIEKYSIYMEHLRSIQENAVELKNYLIENKGIDLSASTMRCIEMVLFYS